MADDLEKQLAAQVNQFEGVVKADVAKLNDAAKKLHLLDRATNAQVPLPGIDVYANPGSLSVSNTGRIAFDDNGNGPALVYESATGQFVETGLAAANGHRQTRLSSCRPASTRTGC